MKPELIYKQTYQESQKHLNRLKSGFNALKTRGFLPLDEEKINSILEDDFILAILDQIVYRFSKLQNSLSKLIKSYLYMKGENVENLTMIDILHKLEKLDLGIGTSY